MRRYRNLKFGIIFRAESIGTLGKVRYILETFNSAEYEFLMIKNYIKQFNYKNLKFVLNVDNYLIC